jgi:hypothetical protein
MGFVVITTAWIVIFVFPIAIAILVPITLWITTDALKILKDEEEQFLRTINKTDSQVEERLKRKTQILLHSKFSSLRNISYFMHNIDELYQLNTKLKKNEKIYGSCLREEKAKILSIKLQIEKLIQNAESAQNVEEKSKNFNILTNMKESIDKLEKKVDKSLANFQN